MKVPVKFVDIDDQVRRVSSSINLLYDGKTDAYGSVTLAQLSATTVVTDERVSAASIINFMPTTANAATEIATMYVSSRGDKTFTITHANNAQSDRTFEYVVSTP